MVIIGRLISTDKSSTRKYGTHEIILSVQNGFNNPYFDVDLQFVFIRPDGSEVKVDGFYDGKNSFKGRAYCDQVGKWCWISSANHQELNNQQGEFRVISSLLKGKLRIDTEDPHQFVYDNGDWFLHIGDTAYRYPVDTEPNWKEYIDQAADAGFTKIRVWPCQDRRKVQALFQYDRKFLNLCYWQEIDRRLRYALNQYPHIIFQFIIFGKDVMEVKRYADGDREASLAIRYAQARFSSFANITWCLSNDFWLIGGANDHVEGDGQDVIYKKDLIKGLKKAGQDLWEREPWGTLITNHQSRFSGYMFIDEPWSEIITLEDLGQVGGNVFSSFLKKGNCPVILDEDRYEYWRAPQYDRYFFRRLMWSSLLSGGHATYGGLKTYEQYDGNLSGIYGYFNACEDGKLQNGAHDFIQIHKFFKDTGLTLMGMVPDDTIAGNQPLLYKVIRSEEKDLFIIYLANPDIYQDHAPDGFNGYYADEFAAPADSKPSVSIDIADGSFRSSWFNPLTGEWSRREIVSGGKHCIVKAPDSGDWVLLVEMV